MKAVVKVDIIDGKCVVIYSDGSEQELYEYPSDEGGGGDVSLMDEKLISHNGVYSASSDGYDGYKKVNVNVVAPAPILKRIELTNNGLFKASDYYAYGFEQVTVNVPTSGGGITDGTVINNWDFTQSRFDTILGQNVILANGATYSSDGVLIGTQQSNATFGVWCPNMSYEFEFGDMEKTFTTGHGRFIMYGQQTGLIYNSAGYWGFYDTYSIMETKYMMKAPAKSLANPARQIFQLCFLQNRPFSGISPRLHLSTILSIR